LRQVKTLVLRLTSARALEFRKNATKKESRHTQSAVNAAGGRLLKALRAFLARCLGLHSVVVEAVSVPVEFFASLGTALAATKSGENKNTKSR
jgi:hypothetical protein